MRSYASSYLKVPADWSKRWRVAIVNLRPMADRGGGLIPAEGGIWQCKLWGYRGDGGRGVVSGWTGGARPATAPMSRGVAQRRRG